MGESRGGEQMHEQVQKIQDLNPVREMYLPERLDPIPAIANDRDRDCGSKESGF